MQLLRRRIKNSLKNVELSGVIISHLLELHFPFDSDIFALCARLTGHRPRVEAVLIRDPARHERVSGARERRGTGRP